MCGKIRYDLGYKSLFTDFKLQLFYGLTKNDNTFDIEITKIREFFVMKLSKYF